MTVAEAQDRLKRLLKWKQEQANYFLNNLEWYSLEYITKVFDGFNKRIDELKKSCQQPS